MVEGPKFTGLMGAGAAGHDLGGGYYDMAFYRKLEEGSNISNMSIDSAATNGMSLENSSVGSSDSHTGILNHPGLRPVPAANYSVGHSVLRPGRVSHALTDDALAQALMDPRHPTETLENYDEWAIDLPKLNMGMAFAQGAFGKLYRGSYKGEDVAIKLLERPENDLERAQLMEQQFVQEVMMLANLRHPNIVRFVGACRKPVVWCILTEYAKGGSVREFLRRRQNRSVPLKLAVKQALDVARGMAYVHGLGFIHRDLKSDNLLISTDKSIKIADFGVARIEVQTEGMTPETGTYRWMAPTKECFLKHMVGKVVGDGTERLQRRYVEEGYMEYWLEPTDLAELRQKAGVRDLCWIPPVGWRLRDATSPCPYGVKCGNEMSLPREEVATLRRQVDKLNSISQLENQAKDALFDSAMYARCGDLVTAKDLFD